MAQSPETHSETQAQSGGAKDTTRSSGAAAERGVDGERRTFAEGENAARQTAATGARAVRDLTADAAHTSRRLAETGRQTTHEVADLWRSSLDPLPSFQLEMTRLFDDFWRGALGLGGFPAMRASRPFAGLGPAALFGQPPVDVRETEHAYLLAIEAPGLNADDLDLSLDGDSLTVRGHKTEEREDATATYRISERRFGRFERRFPVAPDVERKNIEAQYRDGVLKITLPKRSEGEGEQRRSKIEIQRERAGR